MRRFLAIVGAVLVGGVLLPNLAQAQVIVPSRVYVAPPPVVVVQSPPTYYVPSAPTVTTTRYSYYPSAIVPQATTITYSSPAPVVTYAAPVVTYSAPAIVAPAPGYYETTTSYGLGIFRPRGWTTTTYYRP